MNQDDLSDMSMIDLFRVEVEGQTADLISGLLALERNPTAADQLEACMRAAHSLKGAARIIDLTAGVDVAHVMEECFVAAQRGTHRLNKGHIDLLLRGVDLLTLIAKTPEAELGQWNEARRQEVDLFVSALRQALTENGKGDRPSEPLPDKISTEEVLPPTPAASTDSERTDRVLRVTADNLNRLLGLSSEVLVESRWLKPFTDSLLKLKRLHHSSSKMIERVGDMLPQIIDERARTAVADARHSMLECESLLAQRLVELEMFDRRSDNLAHRLYDEALSCRMRPFNDGVRGLPRVVRDLAHSLGKQARLEIIGAATEVDRDILEKLDAPLGHLLRNAVDHGVEFPDARRAQGKPAEGTICLEARHSAGKLQIIVSDDGSGIDIEKLRKKVVERKLTNTETAAKLSEAELLEFLFLPGFTTREVVTDVSGRGVGLDVVQDMIKQVRGVVRVTSELGGGTRVQLELPLTLSVVRALLVDIGGESYAFPLAHVVRTLKLQKSQIDQIEGRQHFNSGGQQIGLVAAHQYLGTNEQEIASDEIPVILIGDSQNTYGLVVDGFLGERELVVQPLDARLGKIKDISAAAVMTDGSPVLIIDVEDMISSIERLIASGRLSRTHQGVEDGGEKKRKRVLVVDDSFTVRELERKLLSHHGYDVEVETDGMTGWNAVRTGHFDLVVTDVDMPRMDGIELVTLIRKDPNVRSLPVLIVSYKDREEDRRRGLDAGADYYLTKGSFHDETLLQAVVDLIGAADA